MWRNSHKIILLKGEKLDKAIKIHIKIVSLFNVAPISIKYLKVNVIEVSKIPMPNCQKS